VGDAAAEDVGGGLADGGAAPDGFGAPDDGFGAPAVWGARVDTLESAGGFGVAVAPGVFVGAGVTAGDGFDAAGGGGLPVVVGGSLLGAGFVTGVRTGRWR